MIFGKEREAVRNATRAIRDLAPRPGAAGIAGLFGGLGAVAPGHGSSPGGAGDGRPPARTLRDLGERVTAIPGARRRAPAMAFAAQALAGSVRNGATLRERYLNLLAAAMDGRPPPASIRPSSESCVSSPPTRCASSACSSTTVRSRSERGGPLRFGGALSTELRN